MGKLPKREPIPRPKRRLRVDATGKQIELEEDGARFPVIGYVVQTEDGIEMVARSREAFTIKDVRAFAADPDARVKGNEAAGDAA